MQLEFKKWRSVNVFRTLLTACALTMAFAPSARAVDLVISTPTQFTSLDGSAVDSDGIVNGIFVVDDLLITAGGSISRDDPSTPSNASAGPIKIVAQNLVIEAGGSITAENRIGSGSGGNISIIVSANIYLAGTSGATPGAIISSRKVACSSHNNSGRAGDIIIECLYFNTDPGSVITSGRSTQTDRASAGSITVHAETITVSGEISSRSAIGNTGRCQLPGGGPIFLVGSLALVIGDTAVISSKGRDPGADLIHIEAPLVFIAGLVESIGQGTCLPNYPSNHLGCGYRYDKSPNSVAGIEVWADYLTIDGAYSHGELNADIGADDSKCGQGRIDIYARSHIEVFGPTSGKFAVHSNGGSSCDTDTGGIITVMCAFGDVMASGQAFQADAVGNGDRGGKIVIEGALDLSFDTAVIFARGDYTGSHCYGGGYGKGGTIKLRSHTGSVYWTNGGGDVRPTGTGLSSSSRGVIQITYGALYDLTGTSFPAIGGPTTPGTPIFLIGAGPVIPSYVVLPLL